MIDLQARVKNIDIFQNTITLINENKDSLFQRIQDDLFSKKQLLEETRQEDNISNNMLVFAKAIESEKLAELLIAESEMATAIASQNPIAISAAASKLAASQREYQAAKDHRERLEYRYDLAKQCLSIAEIMYSEVEMKYAIIRETIQRISAVGVTRLFNAKNDLESYLRKSSQSLNSAVETPLQDNTTQNKNISLDCDNQAPQELSTNQKELIKKETGWDDEIIDRIKTMSQYEIYKNANLTQKEINGRKCLVKNINLDYVDPKSGKTNRELMAMGRSPYDDKTGERIELHHMNQEFDGPFAELAENTEHGDGNQTILHLKGSDSWRNDPQKKNQYKNHDRPEHWQKRLEDIEKNG